MTVREFIEDCRKRLLPLYDEKEAASLASRALEDIFNISRTKQLTYPNYPIGPNYVPDLSITPEQVIDRLCSGEPVQYIAGFEYFCGSKFRVGPGVLIPRPETEELVNLILSDLDGLKERHGINPYKIFDVCTGSGCIAWTLQDRLSKQTEVETYGCDISEEAVRYARHQGIGTNNLMPHTSRFPMFLKYDVLNGDLNMLKSFIGKLDVIVSNPPYIAEKEKEQMHRNVLDFEPAEALFVPDDNPLVFYERIAGMAKELLRPGGLLYFEINPLFAEGLKTLLEEEGFKSIHFSKDLAGRQRFLTVKQNLPNQ